MSKGSNHILSETLKHPEMAAKIRLEILCKFLPAPFFSYITFCTVPMELSRDRSHADHSQWFYYTLEAFCLTVLWDCVFRTDKRWRFRSDRFKKHFSQCLLNEVVISLASGYEITILILYQKVSSIKPFNWVLAATKSILSLKRKILSKYV